MPLGRLEGIGDLDAEVEDLGQVHGLAPDLLGEGLAPQQLHDDEVLALVLLDGVHGADARVVQGRGRAGLALEPLEDRGIALHLLRQDLHGHVPAQPGVLRLVDDAHAAGA